MTEINILKEKNLCCDCVQETYLSDEIRNTGRRRRCSYCGEIKRSYKLEEVSDRVDEVFEEHYYQTSDQMTSFEYTMHSDPDSSYDWERDGTPVVWAIAEAAEVSEEIAEDIQQILADKHETFDPDVGGEAPFDSESYYAESGVSGEGWQEAWNSFERSLKREARYFSRQASDHLKSIFVGIGSMRTRNNRGLIVNAGPKTRYRGIYRARVFQSDVDLVEAIGRPDKHLAAPPHRIAAAGRMNARGISVFYGANRESVAIAEVRPPVGSQVAVAKFLISRPLRLLDLTALADLRIKGSIFDPTYGPRLERAEFLRSLSKHMVRAVMPDDEVFDYLPTQVVADYLATESDLQVDGIIFPSVQAGAGLNFVLFHKSAASAPYDIPDGTEVTGRTWTDYEDGPERDYSVIEETPLEKSLEKASDELDSFLNTSQFVHVPPLILEDQNFDDRQPALEIDMESLRVHVVSRVTYKTSSYPVRRHRWEKRESDF